MVNAWMSGICTVRLVPVQFHRNKRQVSTTTATIVQTELNFGVS